MKTLANKTSSFLHAKDAVASAKILAKKVSGKEAMILSALLLSRKLDSLESSIKDLEEAIRDQQ